MKTAEEVLYSIYQSEYAQKSPGHTFHEHHPDYVLKAMEEYADQFKLKWIPVTEPPESGTICNIKKGKGVNIACYSKMDNSWSFKVPDGKIIEYTGITHYCKLPEL